MSTANVFSRRSATLLSLLLLSGFFLTGCGLRYDNPPDTLPSLDAGQTGILQASLATQAIISSADTLSTNGAVSAPIQSWTKQIREQAASRLQALGGVWEPWPEGTPPGAEAGPQALPVPAELDGLVQLLMDSGQAACLAADTATDATATALLTGICAANRLDASNLAVAAGMAQPFPTKPDPTFTNPEGALVGVVDKAAAAELTKAAASLDYARYRAETAAALLQGEDSTWAVSRANTLAKDVDRLVMHGAIDPRTSQYALDFSALSDSAAALQLLHQADAAALSAHLLAAQSLPSGQRAAMVTGVRTDAFSQARYGIKARQIFSILWP